MYQDKKKKMGHGGMGMMMDKKKMGMMGGGKPLYNKGGYVSIQDMEKDCGSKVSYNRMK